MTIKEYVNKELDMLDESHADVKKIKPAIIDIIDIIDNLDNNKERALLVNVFNLLIKYIPLSPLTGNEDEWEECKRLNGEVYQQNKRCARVFRRNMDNGTASVIDGILFSDDGKRWFGCKESEYKIDKFPFDITNFSTKHYRLKYSTDDMPVKKQLEGGNYESLWYS